MKIKKNHTKQVAIVSGAIVTGLMAGASAQEANASELFNYTTLGTGSELRNELIDMNMVEKAVGPETIRAKVWEGSCGEGKCGEGKCGDTDKDKKKTEEAKKDGKGEKAVAASTTATTTDKAKKEGEKAVAASTTATTTDKAKKEGEKDKAKEDKTKEAKCGEGKCGD